MRDTYTVTKSVDVAVSAFTCDICGASSVHTAGRDVDTVVWPENGLPSGGCGTHTGAFVRVLHDEIRDDLIEYHFCRECMQQTVMPAIAQLVATCSR